MKFILGNGITMRQLNIHNAALKNEYIDNLISTAMFVISNIRRITGDQIQLIVKRGFIANSVIRNNYKNFEDKDLQQHSRGLAIQLSLETFQDNQAFNIALDFMQICKEFNLSYRILIDIEVDKAITFIADSKKPGVYEVTKGNKVLIEDL